MPRKSINWITRRISVPRSHVAYSLLPKSQVDAPAPVVEIAADSAPGLPETSTLVDIPIPELTDLKNPQKRAEFLLHTAAEIEHALMVQYLYASFSLGPPFEQPPPAPGNALAQVNRWQRSLMRTAREEMGHLITVQNLLRLIGGRLNLEREDFPFRRDYYPFPFTLEPLSPVSLAKYVAAERPEEVAPDVQEIIDLATGGVGMPINRVGILYALLTSIFSRPEDVEASAASGDPWHEWVSLVDRAVNIDFAENEQHLRDEDFLTDTEARQANPDDWGGDAQVFVRVVRNRQEALNALREIAVQGEGLPPGQGAATDSHFRRFKDIFDLFPRHEEWRPARSVGINPSLPQAGTAPTTNTITNVRSRRWAQLFDIRYAILLTSLAHFLESEGLLYSDAGETKGDRTPRGYLHIWTFDEMRRIHKVGSKLSQLPRLEDTAHRARAGAPFTLPATLVLPSGEAARWKEHRDRFEQSLRILDELLQPGMGDEDDPFLQALKESDEAALAVAQAAIVAHTILDRPAHAAAAMEFYRTHQTETVARYGDAAADFYAQQQSFRARPFWARRSQKPERAARQTIESINRGALPTERRLRIAGQLTFRDTPVIDRDIICYRPALVHPSLHRPIAYLEGFDVRTLFSTLKEGVTAAEVAHRWAQRMTSSQCFEILQWMWNRGLIIASEG